MKLAEKDFTRNTDVLKYIKNKKMVTYSVWLLSDRPQRNMIRDLSNKQIVDLNTNPEKEETKYPNPWCEATDLSC